MTAMASTETFVYYRDDGFVFRHPAPRSHAHLQQMEIWDDSRWRAVTDPETSSHAGWYGMPITQAQADASTSGTATHLTANRER